MNAITRWEFKLTCSPPRYSLCQGDTSPTIQKLERYKENVSHYSFKTQQSENICRNKIFDSLFFLSRWGGGCRIHQLYLCRGVRPPQGVSWYDTKQSDWEFPVMMEFGGMWSTPSLPSLPCPFRPEVVTSDMVLTKGQIELNYVHMLKWIVGNRTVFTFNCV